MDKTIDLNDFKEKVPDIEGKDLAPAESSDLETQLDELREGNQERLTRLARFNIAPNPVLELKVRLDTMTDCLMPEDGEARLAYECAYEMDYGELLESLLELGGPRLVAPPS